MLLRQIRYFQAIVEHNSFTEAAEACYISQSAISQQMQSLEKELGVKLIERRNRGFSLTEAGEHFYKRSLVITAELNQLRREVIRIDRQDEASLSLGYLFSYDGDEFHQAIAAFSERYPAVKLQVTSGNHEDLYDALRTEKLDLVLNDQRRAFSEDYENLVLARTVCSVELAAHNPLSRLDVIDIADLKNTPCILIASQEQQEEERRYYREIVGFQGEYLFAQSLQEARMMVVSNRGVLPMESTNSETKIGMALRRVPLTKRGERIARNYCAFWKKDNAGYYTEAFADLLKDAFLNSNKHN